MGWIKSQPTTPMQIAPFSWYSIMSRVLFFIPRYFFYCHSSTSASNCRVEPISIPRGVKYGQGELVTGYSNLAVVRQTRATSTLAFVTLYSYLYCKEKSLSSAWKMLNSDLLQFLQTPVKNHFKGQNGVTPFESRFVLPLVHLQKSEREQHRLQCSPFEFK